jgi:hypothetical protein
MINCGDPSGLELFDVADPRILQALWLNWVYGMISGYLMVNVRCVYELIYFRVVRYVASQEDHHT